MCYVWLVLMTYFGLTDNILAMIVLNFAYVSLFRVYQFCLQFIQFLHRIIVDLLNGRADKYRNMIEVCMWHYTLRPSFGERYE